MPSHFSTPTRSAHLFLRLRKQHNIESLITARQKVTEELVAALGGAESKRFGGYQSNFSGNKGLRMGLLDAKQAIRCTSPCFITPQSALQLFAENQDFIAQMNELGKSIVSDILPSAIQKWRHPGLYFKLIKLKMLMANTLKDFVSQTHSAQTHSIPHINSAMNARRDLSYKVARELTTLCTSILSENQSNKLQARVTENTKLFIKYAEHFSRFTDLDIDFCDRTFLNQCIAGINAKEAEYQRLPGNDGVYEIVGLKGAASHLKYCLDNMQDKKILPF